MKLAKADIRRGSGMYVDVTPQEASGLLDSVQNVVKSVAKFGIGAIVGGLLVGLILRPLLKNKTEKVPEIGGGKTPEPPRMFREGARTVPDHLFDLTEKVRNAPIGQLDFFKQDNSMVFGICLSESVAFRHDTKTYTVPVNFIVQLEFAARKGDTLLHDIVLMDGSIYYEVEFVSTLEYATALGIHVVHLSKDVRYIRGLLPEEKIELARRLVEWSKNCPAIDPRVPLPIVLEILGPDALPNGIDQKSIPSFEQYRQGLLAEQKIKAREQEVLRARQVAEQEKQVAEQEKIDEARQAERSSQLAKQQAEQAALQAKQQAEQDRRNALVQENNRIMNEQSRARETEKKRNVLIFIAVSIVTFLSSLCLVIYLEGAEKRAKEVEIRRMNAEKAFIIPKKY